MHKLQISGPIPNLSLGSNLAIFEIFFDVEDFVSFFFSFWEEKEGTRCLKEREVDRQVGFRDYMFFLSGGGIFCVGV